MVQIQILSDLHFESPAAYDEFEISPSAPYLALLGDIGYTKDHEYFKFLRKQLLKFQTVLLVLGNHEPYFSSMASCRSRLQIFQHQIDHERETGSSGLGRFVLLDQTRYDLSPTLTVLGCTLFSNISQLPDDFIKFGLKDLHRIEGWTVASHLLQHKSDVRWLKTQVKQVKEEQADRRIVVLTHYSPTCDQRSINPKHAGKDTSCGFMTELLNDPWLKSSTVHVWAYGHTHFNCDFIHEETGTRIVANQRGYYTSPAENFDPTKVIEV